MEMNQKFLNIARAMKVSEELVKKLEDELSNKKPDAVVVAKVEKKPELCDLSDEQIDKMSESEAKSALKSYRDEEKSDEKPEGMSASPLGMAFSKMNY